MRRRFRVHVDANHGTAEVRLVRWRGTITDYLTVAALRLDRPDAEERLADARARAAALADQVNRLERDRL